MMKENALFLLELCSSGPGKRMTIFEFIKQIFLKIEIFKIFFILGDLISNQKRSPHMMSVVNENHAHESPDPNKPSTSRGETLIHSNRSSKYIPASGMSSKDLLKTAQYRNSVACHSPELIWQIPEVFACLESLGASVSNDTPYDVLTYADNSFDRVSHSPPLHFVFLVEFR